ncbi:CBS domain-containing protein [Gallaecimonas kandeliae]|uniref:CBS domain-containing protein n=1 Tax=Gallaecimonas kandeliae TaxID=3029055 RepID=UPI00264888B3|nr:CBS domain-containing protein [Gallaecimonas kandeliae]WKE64055.1 CBS domain-containing protein [Gallaecimonas kandeliae]
MKTVADIMTRDLITLPLGSTLLDAHDLMREKGIRHIPVMDGERFAGILTQKIIMASVIRLLVKYGGNALERREGQLPVAELMATDCATLAPDQPLDQVADFFLAHKHGCLPVLEKSGTLVGILTSSDFVRLCQQLLKG